MSLRLEGEYKYRPVTIHDTSGHITLPRLEILVTGLKIFPNASFPSLKHLVIPYTGHQGPTRTSYLQLLNRHQENLESLICNDDTGVVSSIGGSFWTFFPKLRLFGVINSKEFNFPLPGTSTDNLIEHFVVTSSEPQYYNIRQLILYISTVESESTQVNLRSRFPKLRSVTCDQHNLGIVQKLSLGEQCARLGIEMKNIVARDRLEESMSDNSSAARTLLTKILGRAT